jgi:hypothetical protein
MVSRIKSTVVFIINIVIASYNFKDKSVGQYIYLLL